MSFSDLFKKGTEPHVDTPAQAKARADAAATVKAKADAKSAKAASGGKAPQAAPAAEGPTRK